MEPAEPAPLPVLSGATVPGVAPPRNDWRMLVGSVAVYNAPSMTEASATVTKQVPAVPLSSFRTGEIRFDADGIVIEGMAVQMSAKWQKLSILIAVFPQPLLPIVTGMGKTFGVPTGVRVAAGVLLFAYFVALILVGNWIDKQRAETTLCLSWDSVRAVQTDHLLRSVTLV
ncbi:MAG: hypothetical protein H7Y38_00560, partial [Armatimonadetes bacterium]|nr:hypothetical protein [Armatimonadota bacterium]